MGPTTKEKEKKIKNKRTKQTLKVGGRTNGRKKLNFFLILFSWFSFSDSRISYRQNSSGQTRKVLYATRATREYQKHDISPRIQVNIRKIQIFSFSQIYGVLLVP